MFQNNIWNLIKLFYTSLMLASRYGHLETVKVLLEHGGIDVNAKSVYLITSKFYSIFRYFKMMIGISSNY